MGEPSTDVQGRIFISYRRDDTAYPAGWLFDRLAERFGEEQHRPDWSPDGKLIAFDAVADGSSDIHAVNVETGVEGPLVARDPNDEFASWGVSALEPEQGGPESDANCTD
jgi:dipeptidyl aminopeptidase/acylaminoacyl peptidase